MKFEKFIYLDIYQVLYRTNTNFCTLERNLFFLFNFLYYIDINIFTNIFQPIILDLNLSLPIWIYLDIQPPSLSLLFFFFFISLVYSFLSPRQGPRALTISESHKSIGQFESFVGYIRSSYLTRQEFEP